MQYVDKGYKETVCRIRRNEHDSVVLAIGRVRTFQKDVNKFSKKFGRKSSLKKALRLFDKDDRTIIWDAYFKEVKK